MVSGALLNWIMRPRLGAGRYVHAGAVAACLVLILGVSLSIWAAPPADAVEESAEQLRYTGKVSVLKKPVPVYGLDSSRVEIVVAGDTVSVTVEFVLVAVVRWDGDTDLCTATMHRLYRGQGRMGDSISVGLRLVDSSDKLEGPDCEGIQVPKVQNQTLKGAFLENGTFKGSIRNAWAITAARVAAAPPTTETTTSSPVTSGPSTTASTTSPPDTIPPTMTEEEFDRRVAEMMTRAPAKWRGTRMEQGYIGVVIAATGDCQVYDYTGRRMRDPVRPSVRTRTGGELTWIRLGDTLRTSSDGRMRVELCNYDEVRQRGPSVINICSNTEMVFDSMEWGEDASSSTWIELIRGAVRTFFKGFERDSGFSIRAGVSVGGIRGSDVFIGYDPTDESVAASVLEGHMDVTSSTTGETESLTALRSVVVRDGEIGAVRPFTEEQWSIMVKAYGVENMQGLSSEEREALWSQAQTSGGSLAPVIAAGVVVAAAIGAGGILLRRRRHGAG
jgi:hypothetical protein